MKLKDFIIYLSGLPDAEKELEVIQHDGDMKDCIKLTTAEVIESGVDEGPDGYDERLKVDGLYYSGTKFIVFN